MQRIVINTSRAEFGSSQEQLTDKQITRIAVEEVR